jgi:amidohydrolase
VLTVATVHAGVRHNIIPEDMTMTGTLRTFDAAQREAIQKRIAETVQNLAKSYGATAEVRFARAGPVTFNDPALSRAIFPALVEAAGDGKVNQTSRPTTVSEDFSYFQQKIPGVFYHLGASADGADPATSPPNHSPQFDVNEKVLPLGVRTHVLTAVRWLEANATR